MTASTEPARAQHCLSFDGLRGIAIVGVMSYHQQVPGFALGCLGVDLFLVLSGFLITTLLIGEHAGRGEISYRSFWLRRVLRLSPLYFLYLSVLAAGWFSGLFSFDNAEGLGHLVRLGLYVYNISQPDLELYLHGHGISSHLWSLSLEEQFYLAWPVLCVFILRGEQQRRILLLLVLLAQLLCLEFAHEPANITFPPWTRGLSLTAGCSAALALVWFPRFARAVAAARVQWACTFAIALGFVAVLAAAVLFDDVDAETLLQRSLPELLLPTALLCAALWQGRDTQLSALLSWRPLVYVGKISYGLYIWHMLCHAILADAVGAGSPWLPLFAQVFALLVASLSYSYYERPFLKLKAHFAAPRGRRLRHQIHTPVTLSSATPSPVEQTSAR